MPRYEHKRTGWIDQLVDVLDDDGSGREFDRFRCHWQGQGPGGFHLRFGPACVSLADALAWCAEHTRRAFVNGFGNARWSVGTPAEGFPALPVDPAPEALSWDAHVVGEWETTVSLNLGFRDYANAAAGFGLALATGPYAVRDVAHDDLGARLRATVKVAAPTEQLAAVVAAHEVRRAATDGHDGLLDEQADALGVSWR